MSFFQERRNVSVFLYICALILISILFTELGMSFLGVLILTVLHDAGEVLAPLLLVILGQILLIWWVTRYLFRRFLTLRMPGVTFVIVGKRGSNPYFYRPIPLYTTQTPRIMAPKVVLDAFTKMSSEGWVLPEYTFWSRLSWLRPIFHKTRLVLPGEPLLPGEKILYSGSVQKYSHPFEIEFRGRRHRIHIEFILRLREPLMFLGYEQTTSELYSEGLTHLDSAKKLLEQDFKVDEANLGVLLEVLFTQHLNDWLAERGIFSSVRFISISRDEVYPQYF